MKGKCLIYVLVFGLAVTASAWSQTVPQAVSPGSEAAAAVVGVNCPTFSWSEVAGAVSYRVDVYLAAGTTAAGYEETARLSTLVLQKEIPGAALSWTPSWEERLSAGADYVWYVGAMDGRGYVTWSKGKMFRVETGISLAALESKVKEKLKVLGVSEGGISDVLKEVRTGVEEVQMEAVPTGGVSQSQGVVRPAGWEGQSNTFYGLYAGSNTTGDNNSLFGFAAGYYNYGGQYNSIFGSLAGYNNSGGELQLIFGIQGGAL